MEGRYLIDIRRSPPPGPAKPGCGEIFILILVGIILLFVFGGGMR